MNTPIVRRHLAAFAVVASAILGACGGDSPTGLGTTPASAAATVTGKWALQSINGSVLPYDQGTFEGVRTEILGDTYDFKANGVMQQTTSVRVTMDGDVTTMPLERQGTYVLNGAEISVAEPEDTPRKGQVNGSTLTMVIMNRTYVYKKQ